MSRLNSNVRTDAVTRSHAALTALRSASDIISRVTPDMKMLMPNSVPTTQSELSGQCFQIKTREQNGDDAVKQHPSPAVPRLDLEGQHQREDSINQQE